MLEELAPGEKKEWRTELSPRMIRTGCRSVWDAIFWSFREYREASPERQNEMIMKKTGIDVERESLMDRVEETIQNVRRSRDSTDTTIDAEEEDKIAAYLVPDDLLEKEWVVHIRGMVAHSGSSPPSWEKIREEMMRTFELLAEHNLRKKVKEASQISQEELHRVIVQHLERQIPSNTCRSSYQQLQDACRNMDHHVLLLNPEGECLLDTLSWGRGLEGSSFRDCILVLTHPSGQFDSLGASSFTKDGHQKITRIFSSDDDLILTLRQSKGMIPKK